MKIEQLKQLIKEEIQNILNESIDMRKAYEVLKTNGYGPRVIDGGRLTGIKAIEFGSYDEETGEDYGLLTIHSDGTMYDSQTGFYNIESADEIIDTVEQFKRDQRGL